MIVRHGVEWIVLDRHASGRTKLRQLLLAMKDDTRFRAFHLTGDLSQLAARQAQNVRPAA